MSIERGFVTIAVGADSYYKLAENLLKSYRFHTKKPMPFAIIADRENDITRQFDATILLNNPTGSYMDKIEMFNHAPFDESIFLDADCLIYGDINTYWDLFGGLGGVRCFGHVLPIGSSQGWFDYKNLGLYQNNVDFELQIHGGILYFTKDEITKHIYLSSKVISSNYQAFNFRMFEKPADEPIVALAMAIHKCHPVEWSQTNRKAYLFYPVAKACRSNILQGKVSYTIDGENWIDDVKLIHWQNHNTEKPHYSEEVFRLTNGKEPGVFRTAWIFTLFFKKSVFKRIKERFLISFCNTDVHSSWKCKRKNPRK